MELELENNLRAWFPYDAIEPIKKGVKGGDVLQKVWDGYGRECGVILWESKHTKGWTAGWIQKLIEDQREAKAELAVIVSKVPPPDIKNFGDIEGVYVTSDPILFCPQRAGEISQPCVVIIAAGGERVIFRSIDCHGPTLAQQQTASSPIPLKLGVN